MASDGPGKFKEKKSRSSKPYDRPKGIISRVTDSVTGLFSSSWLSGWMAGGEEDDEASDPQQAGTSQVSVQSRVTTQVKTMAPPGESFIFAQPVTARRPFRPIYPEEGEVEGNNAHGVNVGASTSSGVRMNLATATSVAIPTTVSTPLTTESPSPVLIGRRHPIISSTPTFTVRSKSQLEPRPMSLLSSSTPTGDDGSEFSESSVDTGVDASVIPRPDERDYQREILQLDDESLRSLRDSLAKSAPAPPNTQPASALPSLEETRKRPRDADPDQTSVRAEGSISNRSLFSEAGDVSLSQPQPSALASKRPRFNVSTYGSPVMFDRSVLSDSSFKMSPFYPGKTMFGGASIYRRGRQQTRAQTARVQVKPKPAQSSDDGGLSQSARRILECLEQMSTPISDAKRIPTPIPGQRGSFLDAGTNYTAAYHRHRPSPRQAGPPTSKPSTPVKVSAPDKLVKKFTIDVTTSAASGNAAPPSAGTTTTHLSSNKTPRMEPETLRSGEGGTSSNEGGEIPDRTTRTLKEDFSSSFSKAVAEATAKFKPASNASLPSFEFAPKPPEATAALASGTKKAGGKVVVKTKASGRACAKPDEDDEVVEDPKLPAVTLKMTSLPKIDFYTKTPHKVASSSPEGFKFASPEVVLGDKIPSEDATILPLYSHTANLPVFTFSSPAAVGRGNVNNLDSAAAVVPTVPLLFNSCSSGFSPKLKEVIKKDKTPSVGQLKEGSILDILKLKRTSPEKIPKENNSTVAPLFNSIGGKSATVVTSFTKLHETIPGFGSEQIISTVNSVPKKTESSQVFQGFSSFMKSSDEWECSVCMLRNKNMAEKCVACETSKPGLNSNSSDSSSLISNAAEDPPPHAFNSIVGGWGNAFKKSDSEWECEMCMVRNKDSSEKCVACETPKPGSKSEPLLSQGSKVLESKEEKTNIGFGSMFVKAKGEWECATCLVRNKSDASRCVSCETPKPGAAAVSQAITGNFRFGANTHDSSTSSTFKFGLSDSQSEVKSSSGFKFGVSAKNTEESNSKGSGGFKFGVSEEVKLSALTEVSRDVASDKSKENSSERVSSSSSFTFGVKKSSDKANETDSRKVPNFSFSAKKLTGSESETANVIKTGFNFKASSQDATFTFGAGLKRKTESNDKNGSSEIKPVSELKSGSVADVLKGSDSTTGAFSFGSKVQKPEEGNAVKPPSIFNNALSSLHNDGGSKNIAPAFGGPKAKETVPTAPSLIFGSKTGDAAAKPNSFTFGGEVSKGSDIASPFSFTSPISKDEAKPASLPSFSFGSKRELSESEEPPKKITFGSCASSTTLTNNVNSKSASLFTFGSKENTLNTGSGFGPPPTSTPAFGAPAPTCNATPNFQFGHNNNPVPAATAPAPAFGGGAAPPAFSGSAAAFGNNNSTAASFAFGQGSKKNVSAGFDFGQAANQAFNFAGAGVTAPVFQFGGQKQSDPSAGLFQFGTGTTGVESAPAFGGENPFNTPAPPSGRVVKKARRRKQ